MQHNALQSTMQPVAKLIQSNMDLLTKFWMSPEVFAQSMGNVQNLLLQRGTALENGTDSATLVQSHAFAEVMQGMVKNYTEFMRELGQSWMSALTQGQQAITGRAEEVVENFANASKAPGRRGRAAS